MRPASVWAVVDRPPRLGYPDGFSSRVYHFLTAIAASRPLDILALHRADICDWTPQGFLPPGFPVCHFWCEALPSNPLNGPGLKGKWRRLRHYLLDPRPYMSYPLRLPRREQHWREHRPELVILFLPHMAHFSLEVPETVPCVSVLEEGMERSLTWATQRLRAPVREWVRRTEQRRADRLYRRLAQRAGCAVVISDAEKRWFARTMPADRITTIPHGLDCDYFTPAEAGEDVDIGIFGRLSELRTYEAARDLFEYVESRGLGDGLRPRWAFVGHSPHPSIRSLDGPRVSVTGSVPDIRPYYARTRVVVAPQRRGTGVKTTVLEAWAMGKPVVATPFALTGLPARPGENVLVGDTLEELRHHIAALLSSTELRRRLGLAARETVLRERDIRVLATRFRDVCERALLER